MSLLTPWLEKISPPRQVMPFRGRSSLVMAPLAARAGEVHAAAASAALPKKIRIPAGAVTLDGELHLHQGARGLVIFAHGTGSSWQSPRSQYVARLHRNAGIATVLFDLLTPSEQKQDEITHDLRFDIPLLAGRLVAATGWVMLQPDTRHLALGYFGSSTGGGAALVAASRLGLNIHAVVSRGGRPDLAGAALPAVQSPTLLIVGARDPFVLDLNERALAKMHCPKELEVIGGASHLFQEAGKLEEVARLSVNWFRRHLAVPDREAGG